jgi:hypothetical protein
VAWAAALGLGELVNSCTASPARSSLWSLGAYTNTRTPSVMPTRVGCTPLSSVASHSANPSTMYAGARQIFSHRSVMIAASRTAAVISEGMDRLSV